MNVLSLDDFKNLRGKTVLLRVDLNAAIEGKTIETGPRFTAHAKTIAALAKQGAKVVVLAHQGRKGDDDFTPLKKHAELLGKLVGKKVAYVADEQVVSQKSLDAVKALKPGEILLLDNLRYLDEESMYHTPQEHSEGVLVSSLAPLADLYVDDAFSVAHRGHASVVGFPEVMPSCGGPTLIAELEGANKARDHASHPCVYVLGGNKPKEAIELMNYSLKKLIVDKILAAGVIGELLLIARGSEVPTQTREALRKAGHLEHLLELRDLIHKYHDLIETPFDFVVQDENGQPVVLTLTQLHYTEAPIGDIGPKTATKFAKAIMRAKTVYLKGPPGRYEEPAFSKGTKTILEAISKTGAYTLLGGGHSTTAAQKDHIPLDKISYVSLSGGALQSFLSGKELPGITALEHAAKKFGAKLGARYVPKPAVIEAEAEEKPAAKAKPGKMPKSSGKPKPAKAAKAPKAKAKPKPAKKRK